MKLILTRHGETEGNVKRILADVDDKLTQLGREQARKVSLLLKSEKIDAIYTSPLVRAKETAMIIAKNHPDTRFIIAKELREIELGSYLNKKFDEVNWETKPNDVESRKSLFERAKTILEKALKAYPNGVVLFVSHNALNKAMIRFIRKWSADDKRPIPQGNTAITIFEISKEEYKETLFNCMDHLA